MEKRSWIGYLFQPSEEQLISYLHNKIEGVLSPEVEKKIIEKRLYGEVETPWEVLKDEDPWNDDKDEKNKKIIYVFCKLIKKNKYRICRSAGCGTWEGKSAAISINSRKTNRMIGQRRSFTFKTNERGQGRWIMHEFSLSESIHTDYVICRITKDHYQEDDQKKRKSLDKYVPDGNSDCAGEIMEENPFKRRCIQAANEQPLHLVPFVQEFDSITYQNTYLSALVMDLKPPGSGYHFLPSDEQLLSYYLRNKVRGFLLPEAEGTILEKQLHGEAATPWEVLTDEDPWDDEVEPNTKTIYVYSRLMIKGKNKVSRVAGCGTWEGKSIPKLIRSTETNRVIGQSRAFTFKPKKEFEKETDIRGRWIMHEFSLLESSPNDYVICRIIKDRFDSGKESKSFGDIYVPNVDIHCNIDPSICMVKSPQELTVQVPDQLPFVQQAEQEVALNNDNNKDEGLQLLEAEISSAFQALDKDDREQDIKKITPPSNDEDNLYQGLYTPDDDMEDLRDLLTFPELSSNFCF